MKLRPEGQLPPAAARRHGAVASSRRVAGCVQDFYWGSGLCDDVPALAWFLVEACAPLLLGIAAVAALALGDAARADAVAARVAALLPHGTREQILELVLRTHRDSPILLAISLVAMVWVSAGATGVVERVESRLLGIPRPGGPVALKLRHLGLALVMVTLISLMAIAAVEATDLRARLGVDVPGWILSILTIAVITPICGFLYRVATARRIVWRAALLAGLPAAIILHLTPLLAGYYARAVAGRTPVQVFLVLAGLLFTCYVAAVGLLIGAGLAARRQRALDAKLGPGREGAHQVSAEAPTAPSR